MTFRISTNTLFSRFLSGLQDARFDQALAQEQLSSGLRFNRPSDDPAGSGRALALARRLEGVERYGEAIQRGAANIDSSAASLQHASELIGEARSLVVQALNGTLTPEDRGSLATEFEFLRAQLVEVGNHRVNGQYVFGGTKSDQPPYERVTTGGRDRYVYRGNEATQELRIGEGIDIPINLSGRDVFGGGTPRGTRLDGQTGLALGSTANEGSGFEVLRLRHDATNPGALASVGVTLVDGGAQDTLLGDNALVIDTTAGTVRLGNGPERSLPAAGAADLTDFALENEAGGVLRLDFSGFTGADYTGTVTGEGSVSLDGSAWTAVDFTETDLALENTGTGSVVHVDTTGVLRAGEELATFEGALNVFDLMRGIEEDLNNASSLSAKEVQERLEARLGELDELHEGILSSTSVLGARSQRLQVSGERALDVGVQLEGLLSSAQDADIAEVALDLARADASLQLAQVAGQRLLQTTLLNFLS